MRTFAKNYLDVLRGTYSGLNLVGIENEEEFFIKQVMDAVIAIEQSPTTKELIQKTGLVVDVGFGGGFPLLPLAKTFPEVTFIGFESKNKKVLAVADIAKRLQLTNIKVFHKRIEEILVDIPAVVTFKAVGTCYDMLKKMNTHIVPTSVVFYKGPQVFEIEKKELERKSQWHLVQKNFYELPQTEGRWLITFQNQNKSVCENTKLVNLSSFL